MARRQRGDDRGRPLYMISVAAELSGMHPQTLRIYERRELVSPKRSAGNTRMYSEIDIERLRFIQRLTQDEGINLAGVERIIELENEIECMRAEMDRLRHRAEVMHRRVTEEGDRVRRQHRAEIVMVRRGGLVRREIGE